MSRSRIAIETTAARKTGKRQRAETVPKADLAPVLVLELWQCPECRCATLVAKNGPSPVCNEYLGLQEMIQIPGEIHETVVRCPKGASEDGEQEGL